MDNSETQAILGTRHRTKTNKTKNGQTRDTGNIGQTTGTGRRQIKQRMDNPETQAILGTRHRTKTNETKNGQPRETGNIVHKTQDEDK